MSARRQYAQTRKVGMTLNVDPMIYLVHAVSGVPSA